MKNTILKVAKALLLITLLTITTGAFAGKYHRMQGDVNKADRIEALRIAFISKELNLTPQEAQKFWPVYNSYKSELGDLRKGFQTTDGQQLTAQQQLDLEQKKLDLKKRYTTQFEGALGTQKCNQLYNLEQKFNQKLKELREQRMQQRGMGNGTQGQGPPGARQGGVR